MHIQQLMSPANDLEARSQPRAGGPSDGSAFASTLARAAESSERIPPATRHDQSVALSAKGHQILSEQRQALLRGDHQALEALSATQSAALSAVGREILSELPQALLQGDHQTLEAMLAKQDGTLSAALARLQQQLVQAGHRLPADEMSDGMLDLPGQFQGRPEQSSDNAPGRDTAAKKTSVSLASLLTQLEARLEQITDGTSDNDPAANKANDGLAGLLTQLQAHLEQASDAASGNDPTAKKANGLASLLAQLQTRLEQTSDGASDNRPDAKEANDGLAGLLAQLQTRLGQVSNRPPAGTESLTALQQRLTLIQQAGRLSASDTASVDNGRPEPPRGAETQTHQGAISANEAARTSQAAMERSLAEQTQSLRQINGHSLAAPAERHTDAITETLLVSRQEAPRVGSGVNQPGGEPSGNGLAAASTSPNAGILGAGSAAATSTASLNAPVGTPTWHQQLGQQLVRLSQNGVEQRVELQLHPAELGPLSVSLKMGEQGAQAQFLSAHAQVRQALEQAIPQLREALAEQGISLGETSVGEQRNGNRDSTPQPSSDMLASAGPIEGDEGAAGNSDTGVTHELNPDGRVDLYA